MKVGDIVELNKAPGWYAWLKHKIQEQDDVNSPMNLGSGAWIVGLYSGPTIAQAFHKGEIAELVQGIGRKSEITKMGFLPVAEEDVRYPTYLNYRSNGKGGFNILLCHGYKVLRQVKPSEIKHDIRFGFGIDIGGIAISVNEGYIDREVKESKLHPLGSSAKKS